MRYPSQDTTIEPSKDQRCVPQFAWSVHLFPREPCTPAKASNKHGAACARTTFRFSGLMAHELRMRILALIARGRNKTMGISFTTDTRELARCSGTSGGACGGVSWRNGIAWLCCACACRVRSAISNSSRKKVVGISFAPCVGFLP